MEIGLQKILASRVAQEILKAIMENQGITVTELAVKLRKPESVISRSLQDLKEASLVKWELKEAETKGVKKLLYPSFSGVLVQIAKLQDPKKKINEKDLEICDKVFNHPKVIQLMKKQSRNLPATVFMQLLLMPSTTGIVTKALKGDLELQKLFEEYSKAVERILG